MKIRSRICDMLGIEYPVFQGGMAWVAEGAESGGYVGELHTMALVLQVVDAVDIPVVAAGGICDGRGVAAAFAFGSGALRKAVQEGDKNGSYMAGECAGMVKKSESAEEIVKSLMKEAEQVMKVNLKELWIEE